MSQQYSQLDGSEVIQMYGSSKLTTTGAIAALGGSGVTSEMYLNNGTSTPTASIGQFVGINSASNGVKTVPIPKSTGSRGQIVINDLAGTAGNANNYIQAVPVSGPAVLNGQGIVDTSGGSMTLLDTAAGWVQT